MKTSQIRMNGGNGNRASKEVKSVLVIAAAQWQQLRLEVLGTLLVCVVMNTRDECEQIKY